MVRSLLHLAAAAVTAAVSLGALAACGGASKPRSIDNKVPPAGEPAPPKPADSSAKIIMRTMTGGIIQLDGDHPTAMESATKEMTDHCGAGNYAITQEGEEADPGGTPAWRVHYQCQGAAP